MENNTGTVPTNNEEAAALIEAIYATSTPAGSIPRTAWPFPVSVTELANGILAAGFRRLPVSGDNAEAARAEADRRYPTNHTVDDPFGATGEAQSDPYGYDETANRAFVAGAEWQASQPREAAPSDTDKEALAWVDRHNDVWVFPGGGDTGYSFETQPFSREHIEKKWGPLEPLSRTSHPVQATEAHRAAREFLESALAESDADERDPDGGSGWDVEVDARTILRLLDDEPVPAALGGGE